jgi:signal transduction histidine kinase
MRARDRNFQVRIDTDFDPRARRVNIIPQEIGQAIFNILNNAFDAVRYRSRNSFTDEFIESGILHAAGAREKTVSAMAEGYYVRDLTDEISYHPMVTLRVIQENDALEIRIRDNGCGIPEKIRDKIFQPFFTTKPTGEGTGLGLSLAYDIITRGHSGELIVDTVPGQFSEFIISLPV